MASMHSLAAAIALAAGGLISQIPAYACDERIQGSCKPESLMDSSGDQIEAAPGKKATSAKVAKESRRRSSRRALRRASIRDRSVRQRARVQHGTVAQSSGQERRDRNSIRRSRSDGASGSRRARDDIDTVGQINLRAQDEAPAQNSQAAPTFGPTFSSKPHPSATLPLPVKPLDPNARSLVTAPPSASAASSPPSSPAQSAAPKSASAMATSAPAQQEQRADPTAVSKPEEASDLSPLRAAFLAFAGLLTLGTVVRMVIN